MVDPRRALVLIRKDAHSPWQDRTDDIESLEDGQTRITITFASRRQGQQSKPLHYGRSRVAVCAPGRAVPIPPQHRLSVRGELWQGAGLEVVEFDGPEGTLCKIFRTDSKGGEKSYRYRAQEVEVIPDATAFSPRSEAVLRYFREIAEAKDPDTDPIVRAYQSLDFVHPESALAGYMAASPLAPHETSDMRVFPFRSNLSQQEAIGQALTYRTSIIEGPPGTGKTETILNLIANIVVGDLGSAAVVSLSNAAVENVGEKLQEYGFGHIVAELGNKKKQEAFLARQKAHHAAAAEFVQQVPAAPAPAHIAELGRRVRRLQAAERERAEIRALLAEYELEQEHFERHRDREVSIDVDRLSLLRRPSSRILEFLAETAIESEFVRRPGLVRRIRKFFKYGRMRDIDPDDVEVVIAFQASYYQRRIAELRGRAAELDQELDGAHFEDLVKERQQRSLEAFAASIASRAGGGNRATYTAEALSKLKSFRSFERDYPVVLSTCHSLRRNIPSGHLFDYLIIDEASQVDLLSASLAMSVCRNLVIVGDRKQLAQISKVPEGTESAPAPEYDYGKQSLLSSVRQLYGDDVPSTLLREHYRCHPAIIGFCNRAFYGGELIPYTSAEGRVAPAMRVHPTVRGNHMRQHRGGGKSNQRELDVVLQEVLPLAPSGVGPDDIAFAAPYRQQIAKAETQLSDQIDTVDTVHRLQGRQKRMVVLTTVLSETWQGERGLRFVDDPRLINVAASRAIDTFVLVTNFERLPKSRYVRDLIGYIEYQYPDDSIVPSSVVSVFDLLYRDYEAQLAPLAARLDVTAKFRSEESIRVLIGDILTEPQYGHLGVNSQVFLKNLVPPDTVLTDGQAAFVRRTSSVDFVVYNVVTKLPLLVIEVDGFAWHENNPAQLRRDALKDSILERIRLPLLRLRTTESGEEARIRDALATAER